MKVTDELVDKIAALAKLEFEGGKKAAIQSDMNKILGFMDVLNEVNTEGVEPLKYLTEEYQELRPDISKQTISQKEALSNAPVKDSDYFKVPTVLQK